MRDILHRLRIALIDLWRANRYRRWLKFGAGFVSIFLVFTGFNSIFGSEAGTRAELSPLSSTDGIQGDLYLPFEFQFVGQGQITGGSGETWLIGGVPIHVGDDHTQLIDDLHPGDYVTLSGRILPNRTWLADRIELSQEGESFFTFNGPLEWAQGNKRRIGGHLLFTSLQTKLGRNLIIGDVLLTTFTVLKDRVWMALEIKAFDKFPIEPTPVPTTKPTIATPVRAIPAATAFPASSEGYEDDENEDDDKDNDDKDNDKEDKGDDDKDKEKEDKGDED